jgi:mannose-1-phosphate guanylyltransferase/mannose-1-phosphate guanylyltransferase/phosphomannomutase
VNKAFVLGAGLGTRLKPLTDQLPKPLIPVFHKPLISYAFDHLMGVGIGSFVVNTYHLPLGYADAFPQREYRGCALTFRNEAPVILDTAGGLANMRDLLDDGDPFIVYNGDILTNIRLQPLIDEHKARGNVVTLALRSTGQNRNVVFDPASGCVQDLRGALDVRTGLACLFTGIYIVSPEFFQWLTPGRVESVVPVFLRLIQEGHRVGGVLCDDGYWWDLGERNSYLEAHGELNRLGAAFGGGHAQAIHSDARVSADSALSGLNVIGPGAVVEPGCDLEDCILWPGARVRAGTKLRRCIVRSGISASGEKEGVDF